MGKRGPRPRFKTSKISANIANWKKSLLDLAGITPSQAINQGIDWVISQHLKDIPADKLKIYIEGLKIQAEQLNDKIEAAENLKLYFKETQGQQEEEAPA